LANKYIVKENCFNSFCSLWLHKGNVLIELEYENEYSQKCMGLFNGDGWICDAGSDFAKKYLERMQ